LLIEPQAPQTEMNHPEPPCRAGQSPPQTWLHDWHCACLGEWSQDTPQLVLVAWVLKTLGVEVGQLRGPTLPSHILPSTLGRDPNKPLCFPQGQNLLRTPSAGPGARQGPRLSGVPWTPACCKALGRGNRAVLGSSLALFHMLPGRPSTLFSLRPLRCYGGARVTGGWCPQVISSGSGS
jgi:hypothetical protein